MRSNGSRGVRPSNDHECSRGRLGDHGKRRRITVAGSRQSWAAARVIVVTGVQDSLQGDVVLGSSGARLVAR